MVIAEHRNGLLYKLYKFLLVRGARRLLWFQKFKLGRYAEGGDDEMSARLTAILLYSR
jgi:hypothetical protein